MSSAGLDNSMSPAERKPPVTNLSDNCSPTRQEGIVTGSRMSGLPPFSLLAAAAKFNTVDFLSAAESSPWVTEGMRGCDAAVEMSESAAPVNLLDLEGRELMQQQQQQKQEQQGGGDAGDGRNIHVRSKEGQGQVTPTETVQHLYRAFLLATLQDLGPEAGLEGVESTVAGKAKGKKGSVERSVEGLKNGSTSNTVDDDGESVSSEKEESASRIRIDDESEDRESATKEAPNQQGQGSLSSLIVTSEGGESESAAQEVEPEVIGAEDSHLATPDLEKMLCGRLNRIAV